MKKTTIRSFMNSGFSFFSGAAPYHIQRSAVFVLKETGTIYRHFLAGKCNSLLNPGRSGNPNAKGEYQLLFLPHLNHLVMRNLFPSVDGMTDFFSFLSGVPGNMEAWYEILSA